MIRCRIEEILHSVEEEMKPLVKEYFDYEIPVAKVDDAGITSTGSTSAGNQLPALESEYASYRRKNKLWVEFKKSISYKIKDLGAIVRVENKKEIVLNGDN